MINKLKQAKRMWKNGSTHGEILEVTGLSREIEYAITLDGITPELVYSKLPRIQAGMKSDEIRSIFGD